MGSCNSHAKSVFIAQAEADVYESIKLITIDEEYWVFI